MKYALNQARRVINRLGCITTPVTDDEYQQLAAGDDGELMLESVTLDEMVATYQYDHDSAEPRTVAMFEAITTTKVRLERTMMAFRKSLDKQLAGTGLAAGDPEVGKPRKAAGLAMLTARVPVSDGQSVGIVFHAPDDDPGRITDSDTLVAFRFLLNRRDVTHTVAPAGGVDISLAQVTLALSNLLERNSDKFQAKQADNQKLQDELDTLTQATEALEQETADLTEQHGPAEGKANRALAAVERARQRLAKSKAITEELRQQLAELQQRQEEQAGQPTGGTPADAGTNPAPVVTLGAGDTILLDKIQTRAMNPTLRTSAVQGDTPIWYSQQNASALVMAGSMTVVGQPPHPAAVAALAEYKAAVAAGYQYTYFRISGLQGIYVFEKGGEVLTQAGAQKLAANAGSDPAVPEQADTDTDTDTGAGTGGEQGNDLAAIAALPNKSNYMNTLLDRIKHHQAELDKAGIAYPTPDEFMAKINAGEAGGFSIDYLKNRIADNQKSLIDLEAGRIRGDKIVGRNAGGKPAAIKWLNRRIAEDQLTLTVGGMGEATNLANYRHHLAVLLKERPEPDTGTSSSAQGAESRLAAETPAQEWIGSKLTDAERAEPAVEEARRKALSREWKVRVEDAAAAGQRLPDPVLDSYVELFGEGFFQKKFAGEREQQGYILPSQRTETTPGADGRYYYGLQARPAGIGAIPNGQVQVLTPERAQEEPSVSALLQGLEPRRYRHGVVAYERPLSAEEISQFELVALNAEGGSGTGAGTDDESDDEREDRIERGRMAALEALERFAQGKALPSGWSKERGTLPLKMGGDIMEGADQAVLYIAPGAMDDTDEADTFMLVPVVSADGEVERIDLSWGEGSPIKADIKDWKEAAQIMADKVKDMAGAVAGGEQGGNGELDQAVKTLERLRDQKDVADMERYLEQMEQAFNVIAAADQVAEHEALMNAAADNYTALLEQEMAS